MIKMLGLKNYWNKKRNHMTNAAVSNGTFWYQRKPILMAGLVIVMASLAYCLFPTRFFFLNDDFIHIPMASDGTIGHHNGARHINDFSLYLDYLWSGNHAVGYHITNALLHVCNVMLFGLLLRKIADSMQIVIPRNIVFAMLGLFAIYAVHAEALFWILCRTASLSMLLVLLSWLFLFSTPKRWWFIFPSLSCFVLALFTYETSWLYPIYLIVWWWLAKPNMQHAKKFIWPISATWLVFATYFPIRKWMINEIISTYEAGDIIQPNVMMIIGKSVRLFFRTFLPPISHPTMLAAASALVLLLLALLVWKIWKHKLIDRLWLFLTACWLISYLPFVSLGVSATGYESDRYLYFATAFAALWIIYSLYLLTPFLPKVVAISIAGLFSFHILFLAKTSNDYEAAGNISKTTMRMLKTHTPNNTVDIYKLPASWKGIPIFRYGFADALNWQLGNDNAKKVRVISTTVFTGKKPAPTESTPDNGKVIIRFSQQ
jgi:hypothetical protein